MEIFQTKNFMHFDMAQRVFSDFDKLRKHSSFNNILIMKNYNFLFSNLADSEIEYLGKGKTQGEYLKFLNLEILPYNIMITKNVDMR